jgi:hypothetical protein
MQCLERRQQSHNGKDEVGWRLFTAANCEAITAAATVERWSRGLSITAAALTPSCLEGRVANWPVRQRRGCEQYSAWKTRSERVAVPVCLTHGHAWDPFLVVLPY